MILLFYLILIIFYSIFIMIYSRKCKNKLKFWNINKTISIIILLSFLIYPIYIIPSCINGIYPRLNFNDIIEHWYDQYFMNLLFYFVEVISSGTLIITTIIFVYSMNEIKEIRRKNKNEN